MKGLLARLDRLQRSRSYLAFPFAVIKKFGEDQSSNLAVLITYYAFFSVFPLLFALSEGLGLVLNGEPSARAKIAKYATANLPHSLAGLVAPTHGSVAVVVITALIALYSGLGVAKAAQTAWNTMYLVARTDQPGFVSSTVRAIRLILFGGIGLIIVTAISGAATSGVSLGLDVGPAFKVLGVAVAFVLTALLFTMLFRWLTVRPVSFTQALPGAALAALAFQVLSAASSAFLAHKTKSSSATYGDFTTVIVLLSFFYLESQVILLAAQVNVVRQYRLWPRALTDAPSTPADFQAYEAYAERERFQQHEDVDTSFGDPSGARPRSASAPLAPGPSAPPSSVPASPAPVVRIGIGAASLLAVIAAARRYGGRRSGYGAPPRRDPRPTSAGHGWPSHSGSALPSIRRRWRPGKARSR